MALAITSVSKCVALVVPGATRVHVLVGWTRLYTHTQSCTSVSYVYSVIARDKSLGSVLLRIITVSVYPHLLQVSDGWCDHNYV